MRKSEFARLVNVSRTRVGQWVRAGQISGDALVGVGRDMRIVADIAIDQLNLRLDTSQRYGLRGLSTRLNAPAGVAEEDDDDEGIAFVERHRGLMVDLADVEGTIDEIWVSSDLTVREALKSVPGALEAYTAIRPQLAAIKDAIVLAP
jgi:hypothetical protein